MYGWTWPSAEEEKLATCRGILTKTNLRVVEAAAPCISVSFNTKLLSGWSGATQRNGLYRWLCFSERKKDTTLNWTLSCFQVHLVRVKWEPKKSLETFLINTLSKELWQRNTTSSLNCFWLVIAGWGKHVWSSALQKTILIQHTYQLSVSIGKGRSPLTLFMLVSAITVW